MLDEKDLYDGPPKGKRRLRHIKAENGQIYGIDAIVITREDAEALINGDALHFCCCKDARILYVKPEVENVD